ncbi:hypothetical protein ACHAXN_012507 [Cyclotella atomus]
MGAKSKHPKKKGPKGKKARAKAKLDQVWGESVDEDARKASKVRFGKSRLMPEDAKKGSRVESNDAVAAKVRQSRYDDDGSSSESEDVDDNAGNSFSHFLKRIRQPEDTRMDVDSSSESSAEESEGGSSETESDDESVDDAIATDVALPTQDPFEAHFSKAPLPQLDVSEIKKTKDLVALTQQIRKVNTSMLDSSLDVHLSGPLLDQWESIEEAMKMQSNGAKKSHVRRAWEHFAKGPFGHAREILTRNWREVNKSYIRGDGRVFSSLQLALYPAISRYADVLMTAETRQNRDEINHLLAMHVLEHVLTCKTRIQRHNRRIKELSAADNDKSDALLDEDIDKWRDQGYTSPKVLILFPTRGTCWKFVHLMMDLLGESAFLDNEERFEAEFGPPSVDEDEEKEDDEKEEMKRQRRKSVMKQKGQEWNDLFGDEANDDDDFKIGMSLNPNIVKTKGKKKRVAAENGAAGSSAGVAVKLFTEFYKSDIILASPIGLKMATTKTEGEDDEEAAASDVDFLSSIDICIVARSDVLAMQNWDHVNSILECLNQQPKNTSNIDFSRVRNYFLEGQGENWRQLIMVSKFADPFILSSFRRYGKNIEGQLKLRRQTPDDDADVTNVTVHVKQVFQRVSCESVSQVGSSRLRYFSEHVLPKLMRLKQKHTLIFIPSYFDFVSVRNLLLKQEASFVSVTEYARVSEISRGRARFHQGRKDIMLYTGRAHFFLRHKIKGVRHVIFFGLPEYAEFYSSIINMLDGGLSELEEDVVTRMPLSCLSLFTRYEAHQLERIVGTGNANKMIKGEKSSYLFAT